VIAHVDVASELVLALRDATLERVLTILVVDAFHHGISKDFVGLADLGEALVSLSFLFSWVAKRMVMKSQDAESSCDLLSGGGLLDAKGLIVSGLVVVHSESNV